MNIDGYNPAPPVQMIHEDGQGFSYAIARDESEYFSLIAAGWRQRGDHDPKPVIEPT